jgi:ATP-dependent helicase/nuclease subunit A
MADARLDQSVTQILARATELQRQAADPDVCAWVTASAGSGKTKVLGDRVLRLLLKGARPTGILCLTFTRAAAAEMANRIAERLREWAVIPEAQLADALDELVGYAPDAALIRRARGLFATVLDAPGGMRIETIHAFCQSLLRRFPLEAEVAPHFRLIEERDQAELLFEAREAMLVAAREGRSPELSRALAHAVSRMHEGRLNDLLREFTRDRDKLQRLQRRMRGTEDLYPTLATILELPVDATAESLLQEACADLAFERKRLQRALEALLAGGKKDNDAAEKLAAFLAADVVDRVARFDEYCGIYFTQKGELRASLASKAALSAWPDVADVLAAEARRLDAVRMKIRAAHCLADSHALAVLALDIDRRYATLKARHAALDYEDLILKARDLLLKRNIAQWVLYKLDGGIDHILVDEAQDTNHRQWDLIKALTEEFFAGSGVHAPGRTIFSVGDRKQSIFSFQGADPTAAETVRAHYRALLPAEFDSKDSRPPFRDVPLDVSFRSTAAVLKLVDAVIAGPGRDGVLSAGETLQHKVRRLGQAGLVELWPRTAPVAVAAMEPWALPEITQGPLAPDERLAQAIAEKISRLISSRESLESRGRPIQAGDIMVLVRSRDAFVPLLVRALKKLQVPVSGVDRLALLQDIAVMDLMAFADFLLMPEDDLNLAALLKSPLVGLTEEELFQVCVERGSASVWSRLNALTADSPRLGEAAERLGRYLGRADFHSPFALFAELLGVGWGRRRFHARLGPEADEAIDEFLNLALAYEQGNTPSLQGFMRWLRSTEAEVKRELGDAAAGEVRIMTVHGAKGLQAPIVFLADKPPFAPAAAGLFWVAAAGGDLPLWAANKDADVTLTRQARAALQQQRREEANRLLYVALTRAEDRLYVCGRVGARAATEPGWHEQVGAAIAALPNVVPATLEDWLAAQGIASVEGWQGGAWQYREAQQAEPEFARVKPGLPVDMETAYEAWVTAPLAAEPDPPQPLAPSRPSEPEPATLSPIGADQGYRFKRGLLVHRLLELLPGIAPGEWRTAAERFLGRRAHGLSEEQAAEVRDEVLRILEDPELAALFGPDSIAEVPVVATLSGPDGKVQALTGQIDRLLVRERDCIILDYKSNRPPPMQASQVASAYLRQLAAYRAAIALVYPGKSISCKILWSAVPSLMEIPGALLDRHAPLPGPASPRLDPARGRP